MLFQHRHFFLCERAPRGLSLFLGVSNPEISWVPESIKQWRCSKGNLPDPGPGMRGRPGRVPAEAARKGRPFGAAPYRSTDSYQHYFFFFFFFFFPISVCYPISSLSFLLPLVAVAGISNGQAFKSKKFFLGTNTSTPDAERQPEHFFPTKTIHLRTKTILIH